MLRYHLGAIGQPPDRRFLHRKEYGLRSQALDVRQQSSFEGDRIASYVGGPEAVRGVPRPEARREDGIARDVDIGPRFAERPDGTEALSPQSVGDDDWLAAERERPGVIGRERPGMIGRERPGVGERERPGMIGR